MNRRSFLLGLLSTTAAPVLAKAMPLHLNEIGLPKIQWRLMYQGIPIREVDSLSKWGVLIEEQINDMILSENLPLGLKTVTRIKEGICDYYDEASNMTDEMWEVDDE